MDSFSFKKPCDVLFHQRSLCSWLIINFLYLIAYTTTVEEKEYFVKMIKFDPVALKFVSIINLAIEKEGNIAIQ